MQSMTQECRLWLKADAKVLPDQLNCQVKVRCGKMHLRIVHGAEQLLKTRNQRQTVAGPSLGKQLAIDSLWFPAHGIDTLNASDRCFPERAARRPFPPRLTQHFANKPITEGEADGF